MGPSRTSRARLRALNLALTASFLLVPSTALADWPQYQGDGAHAGLSDGPAAPLAVDWTSDDLDLEDLDRGGGLSAAVVAEDGTIVVVAPSAVAGFSASDGAETFTAERDFGPSSQPAVAEGSEGAIVVFTEGFGDEPPLGTVSPSPSPTPKEDDGDGGFDSHVNAVGLEDGQPVWATPVQLEAVVHTPVAVDDRAAYVGDVEGNVTAVDLRSGEVRWTRDLGTAIAGAVAIGADRVYATTLGTQTEPGSVVALDPSGGDELWRTTAEDIGSNVVSAPVVTDDGILVLEASAVVSLSDEGRRRWRTEVVNPLSTPPFLYQGAAAPAPVSAGGMVFAVDGTGRVYGLDTETGAERWDHALNDDSPVSPPVVSGDQVLVPAHSGTLYAIDLGTGHLVGEVDSGGTFLRGLADAGDLLVGVTGVADPAVVAFASDPGRALLDEPSPTTFDPLDLLAGFALGGLVVGALVVLLTGPLQRRLGPALAPLDDVVDVDEEDET